MSENSVRKERKDPQQQKQQQQQQKGPNERRCEEGSVSETPSQARSTWLKMVNQASEKTELFWGGRATGLATDYVHPFLSPSWKAREDREVTAHFQRQHHYRPAAHDK
uniref:Uncharacterized protein n=1 Tax=Anopheles merus TaxID=30066 RepID=A0A182VIB0_ANOME